MLLENDTQELPFHIYRSGAGSGKTYTLASAYLKLALAYPKAFLGILGVTFTNKATEEMKGRILRYLRELSHQEDHPLMSDLCEKLHISPKEVQLKSQKALSEILHNYGRFSVVTIDSFFHKVIRSFAREVGIPGTFTIDLNTDQVIQEVVDEMLMEIGSPEKAHLRKWLTDFAEERVENGDTWDFRKEIHRLASQVLSDEFKSKAEDTFSHLDGPKVFKESRRELYGVKQVFEKQIKTRCYRAFRVLDDNKVDASTFSRGTSGPIGLFYKLESLDLEITDAKRSAVGDLSKWLRKADQRDAALVELVTNEIWPLYEALIDFFDQNIIRYNSAREVLRDFYTYGILFEVSEYLARYRESNDMILISDLPDFLRKIIHDSDTPYIYEKVGSRFSHYLIDEFQDTSVVQWNNFKPLLKNATDMYAYSMVVGDVKQGIYRFRGGDWGLLQSQVSQDMGPSLTKVNHLDTNYRSGQELVTFNNFFFDSAKDQSVKFFEKWTESIADEGILQQIDHVFGTFSDVCQKSSERARDTGYVHFELIDDQASEDKWQLDAVKRTILSVEEFQRRGYRLSDMAVLTRTAGEGKLVADAFMQYKDSPSADQSLSYEVVSSEALFLTSSHCVQFMISLVRWLDNGEDEVALAEWLHTYQCYILVDDQEAKDVFGSLSNWERLVPDRFPARVSQLKTLPIYELIEELISLFSLDAKQDEYTYIQGFQDTVLDYTKNGRGDLPSFLEWWEDVGKKRSILISDDNNAIKILTIHKSKGLEFPIVFLPFISWNFDHRPAQTNILWCKSYDKPAPFNKLPYVPLRYSSKLLHTCWAEDYFAECLKAYLDNLNLLYVAFTRASEAMIGYGLDKPTNKISYAYDLLAQVLDGSWVSAGDAKVFERGKAPVNGREQGGAAQYGLKGYPTYNFRNKIGLQMKGSAVLNDDLMTAQKEGIHVHALFGKIRYMKDLDVLDDMDKHRMLELIERMGVSDWYSPEWEVMTEVPVLMPGGELRRIDRVNFKEGMAMIIDYKTGSERASDRKQVQQYVRILKGMGFVPVSGYLAYLDSYKIVPVNEGDG